MKRVKNIVSVFALVVIPSIVGYAQQLQRGDNLIGFGFGVGSSLGNFKSSASTPGICLQYEMGYLNLDGPGVLSLGGYLGHKSFSYGGYNGAYTYSQKWSYTIIGFRAAYHYNGLTELKQLDPYGGLMLSYDAVNYTYTAENGIIDPSGHYSSGLGLSGYLGGRWFFNNNIAAFMELGFGVSNLTIGACYKF